MPTFSAEQLESFKTAFSSSVSYFFGMFRELIDWIRSSPLLYYAIALPIAGLIFLLIFLFLRSVVDRDYSGGLGETSLYGRELSSSMTGSALLMRKLFRQKGKSRKKKDSSGESFLPDYSGSNLTPEERQYYARENWKVKQRQIAERRAQDRRDSRLDVTVDDDDLQH